MAISVSTDRVDENRKEHLTYGTQDFPVAFFYDDLTKVTVPWHWHDEYEIVLILQGSVRVYAVGQQIILSGGEGYFANGGVLHAADLMTDTGYQHAMVFSPDLLARENDIVWNSYIRPINEHPDLPFVRLSPSVPWQKEILHLAETAWMAGAYEQSDYPLTVRHALSRIFSLLLRHAEDGHSEHPFFTRSQREEFRVKKALSFIEHHCGEPLTIVDIAKSADISVSACLRCFGNVLHTTPIRYLGRYRLEKAADALSGSEDRTISAIASACGFTDMSYFDRCFRREYGMNPTDYRRKCRRKDSGDR